MLVNLQYFTTKQLHKNMMRTIGGMFLESIDVTATIRPGAI